MAVKTGRPWTAEELCRLPSGWRYEIDEGKLVIMAPAGFRHDRVVSRMSRRVGDFAEQHRLGDVLVGGLGVILQRRPQILRGMDVAFFSAAKVARVGREPGFADIPPDLAIEVQDPQEPDLRRKIEQYLAAGVRAVWVVDPAAHSLTRHGPDEEARTWTGADAVVEEPVMPGFRCRLGDMLGE